MSRRLPALGPPVLACRGTTQAQRRQRACAGALPTAARQAGQPAGASPTSLLLRACRSPRLRGTGPHPLWRATGRCADIPLSLSPSAAAWGVSRGGREGGGAALARAGARAGPAAAIASRARPAPRRTTGRMPGVGAARTPPVPRPGAPYTRPWTCPAHPCPARLRDGGAEISDVAHALEGPGRLPHLRYLGEGRPPLP